MSSMGGDRTSLEIKPSLYDSIPRSWVTLLYIVETSKVTKLCYVVHSEQDVSSLRFCCSHFVAAVLLQPFHRGYTSSPAILSWAHFVASHFVAGTLHRQPFRSGDTLLPAISSQGHFVTGARRRLWNLPELEDVMNSVQPYLYIVYARLVNIIQV